MLAGALHAYPEANAVHMIRDGRDVVCSLLERGWLRAGRGGADDANQAYGAHARFWVEPERREEFAEGERGDPRRLGVAPVRRPPREACPSATIELRYESLAADPSGEAERVAEALDADPAPLRPRSARCTPVGRPLAHRADAGAAGGRRGRGRCAPRRARLPVGAGTLS